jgi:chorismate mutase
MIDRQIVELLNARSRLSRSIAEIKSGTGLPIIDWNREAEILRRVSGECIGIIPDGAVMEIYRAILRSSRQIQSEVAEELSMEPAAV